MLIDECDEDAELLEYVAKAKAQIGEMRKHVQAQINPGSDYGETFQALMWQVFIVGEMEALLAAMEMRLTAATLQ